MSTKESSKLIAEFMGMNFKERYGGIYMAGHMGREIKYYSSWDWLMKAWRKFSTMQIREIQADQDELWNYHYNRHLERISMAMTRATIGLTFERLVQGIQWYNKTKL